MSSYVPVCFDNISLSDRALLWRGGGCSYEQTSPNGVFQKVGGLALKPDLKTFGDIRVTYTMFVTTSAALFVLQDHAV